MRQLLECIVTNKYSDSILATFVRFDERQLWQWSNRDKRKDIMKWCCSLLDAEVLVEIAAFCIEKKVFSGGNDELMPRRFLHVG